MPTFSKKELKEEERKELFLNALGDDEYQRSVVFHQGNLTNYSFMNLSSI